MPLLCVTVETVRSLLLMYYSVSYGHPPEECGKKLQKLRKFFGKIVLNFDGNCAKMAIFICYLNNAKCMLEALLV